MRGTLEHSSAQDGNVRSGRVTGILTERARAGVVHKGVEFESWGLSRRMAIVGCVAVRIAACHYPPGGRGCR